MAVIARRRSAQPHGCFASRVAAMLRDGQIVASRDYHNHAFMAAVMGRLPALAAALGEGNLLSR